MIHSLTQLGNWTVQQLLPWDSLCQCNHMLSPVTGRGRAIIAPFFIWACHSGLRGIDGTKSMWQLLIGHVLWGSVLRLFLCNMVLMNWMMRQRRYLLCSQQMIVGRAALQEDLCGLEKCRYSEKSNMTRYRMWDGVILCTDIVCKWLAGMQLQREGPANHGEQTDHQPAVFLHTEESHLHPGLN